MNYNYNAHGHDPHQPPPQPSYDYEDTYQHPQQQQQPDQNYAPYGYNDENYDYEYDSYNQSYPNEMNPSLSLSGGNYENENAMDMLPANADPQAQALLIPEEDFKDGSFYPLTPPYHVPHGHMMASPHNHLNPSSQSPAPISALAFDGMADALYVASHTCTLGKKRRHATYSVGAGAVDHRMTASSGGSSLDSRTSMSRPTTSSNQVSMLTTHSFPDGMLYSSCAGHAEAPKHVLDSIAQTLYATPSSHTTHKDGSNPSLRGGYVPPPNIPAHAYRPPFGSSFPNNSSMTATVPPYSLHSTPSNMGITTILPFFSKPTEFDNPTGSTANTEAYTCTISPSSIRAHARGGLLLCENPIQGMVCGTYHPADMMGLPIDVTLKKLGQNATHVVVGGLGTATSSGHNLHCLDLYSNNLVAVSSHTVRSQNHHRPLCISDITTCHEKGNIIAGCSDGTVRIFDGSRSRSFTECARVKAHGGGVAHVAVGGGGNLICTTGYSSHSPMSGGGNWTPCTFPEQHVSVFDVRFLGRGGIAHPFSGYKGGPRFIEFLPGGSNVSQGDRILVASGQSGGGLQVITPFEGLGVGESKVDSTSTTAMDYFQPPLDSAELITTMTVSGQDLAIGTSNGNLLQYRMAGYDRVISSTRIMNKTSVTSTGADSTVDIRSDTSGYTSTLGVQPVTDDNCTHSGEKEQLIPPPYTLEPPELSIEPHCLRSDLDCQTSNTPYSIFNAYKLDSEPTLSRFTDEEDQFNPYSFGPLSNNILCPSGKRLLSDNLIALLEDEKDNAHFLTSIPTSKLALDLFSTGDSGGNKRGNSLGLLNMNKLLYGKNFSNICYDGNADPRKKERRKRHGYKSESRIQGSSHDHNMPQRYDQSHRPPYSIFTAFDFAARNDTLFPGWDYAPSMPIANACPVLLMLYFIPEVRNAMMDSQMHTRQSFGDDINNALKKQTNKSSQDSSLSSELGFLFHQIESLSTYATCYPKAPGDDINFCRNVVSAFVPSNFLSTFSMMPEASALALLDGAPAAVEVARRPEAFYRFLLHHLDRELNITFDSMHCQRVSKSRRANRGKDKSVKSLNLLDSLQGMNSVSTNKFVTGSEGYSTSSTRSYTVDLAYDTFISRPNDDALPMPEFGEVLRYSLCKDVRLRAWCQTTKSYETVVQRKIVTSLPKILSISCACSGSDDDRLRLWRKFDENGRHWLPEMIELELEDDGHVVTRQLRRGHQDDSDASWEEFRGNALPSAVTEILSKDTSFDKTTSERLKRYKLDSVLSFISNKDSAQEGHEESSGHHVLHARIPSTLKMEVLLKQMEAMKECLQHASSMEGEEIQQPLTLLSDLSICSIEARIKNIEDHLKTLVENNDSLDEWILFNGINVSSTVVDDALAFHVPFKEPCLLLFREIDSLEKGDELETFSPLSNSLKSELSLSNITHTSGQEPPKTGSLIAFDAEFVQVQNEESALTAAGSKVTTREGRNALGRVSLLDCETGKVIIDDHVLPREPVLDYLTRFSGIRPADLNPRTTSHRLISARHAYAKMRYLVERGCIFVGHGLAKDFLTVNLFVPPSQIIDTVQIYHLEKRRYISLRFLVNYLFRRDMQVEVHDSVEDARAAYDLYLKALELKKEGRFDAVLREIYDHGTQTDWKVGVTTSRNNRNY